MRVGGRDGDRVVGVFGVVVVFEVGLGFVVVVGDVGVRGWELGFGLVVGWVVGVNGKVGMVDRVVEVGGVWEGMVFVVEVDEVKEGEGEKGGK